MMIRVLKSSVGFNAKPENDKEQIAVKLGDKIMSLASMALDEADMNYGYGDALEKEEMVDIEKEAIKSFVLENKDAIKDVYNLIYEHLEDNNYHTTNDALAQVLNIQ